MIEYSQNFIGKCKKVYPNCVELDSALRLKLPVVGDYLEDLTNRVKITPEDILNAKSLEELQCKALIIQERINLYKEWKDNYRY